MDQLRIGSLDLLGKLNAREDQDLKRQRTLNTGAFVVFGFGTISMIGVMYFLYNEVLSYLDARDQAQQQLERFNSELQAMVDERTHELVEANRELQQFAYVASHDCRNLCAPLPAFRN